MITILLMAQSRAFSDPSLGELSQKDTNDGKSICIHLKDRPNKKASPPVCLIKLTVETDRKVFLEQEAVVSFLDPNKTARLCFDFKNQLKTKETILKRHGVESACTSEKVAKEMFTIPNKRWIRS